tara:strand:- start:582 stop:770 length:189 start_codon:yes stop_codon:yes gene_type:complete
MKKFKSDIGVRLWTIEELLEQLKKHSTHMKEKEFEKDYSAGISFAVKVIEDRRFPNWCDEEN